MKLSEGIINQPYRIQKITAKSPLNMRLLSVGFGLGSTITLLSFTMAKQTFDVRVESTIIALRKEEAAYIIVEEIV